MDGWIINAHMDRRMSESLLRKTNMRLDYRGEAGGREISED